MKAIVAMMLMTAMFFTVGCKKENNPDVSGTIYGHEYVDLGLPSGTLWATCNIGANAALEYGDLYAWGETETKTTYLWDNYKYCKGQWQMTKYCNDPAYGYQGFTDTLTVLEPSDDVAAVQWGGGWHMPTWEQMCELIQKSSVYATKVNGVFCCRFIGPNGNVLYLPAAGSGVDGDIHFNQGGVGNYWTSTLCLDHNSDYAKCFTFTEHWDTRSLQRRVGRSVRPVCSAPQK